MSNYRIAYDKGFQDLSERSPHEIAVFLHVRYDSTAESFLVPYFGEDYKVDCKAKTVTKCSDGSEPPIDDAILILHYLTFAELHQTYAPLGKWVSLKEIPNGGSLFYPAFHKDSILGLIHSETAPTNSKRSRKNCAEHLPQWAMSQLNFLRFR